MAIASGSFNPEFSRSLRTCRTPFFLFVRSDLGSASKTCLPHFITGFMEEPGSCERKPITFPRIERSSSSDRDNNSSGFPESGKNVTFPSSRLPLGSRLMIDLQSILFPLPDSPISPSVELLRRSKLASSIIDSCESPAESLRLRFLTESMFSFSDVCTLFDSRISYELFRIRMSRIAKELFT